MYQPGNYLYFGVVLVTPPPEATVPMWNPPNDGPVVVVKAAPLKKSGKVVTFDIRLTAARTDTTPSWCRVPQGPTSLAQCVTSPAQCPETAPLFKHRKLKNH